MTCHPPLTRLRDRGCRPPGFQWIVLFAACMLALSASGFAQSVHGTISGAVSDETGGVIPGAEVSLVNVQTERAIRTVVTDDGGNYRFVEVEPGEYRLLAQMSGFSDAESESINLNPNRNVRVQITLSVAGQTQTITVTAANELIDRESATLGTTVEHRRVEGLPLNGRNALTLALLQPGVTPPSEPGDFGTGLGIQVNGQRGTQNNVTIDGSNNNEVAVGSTVAVLPPPDAIDEFRVLTSNFEAEFGRNTGSIINIVTRAGTSAYHGNVRFFWRPTILSAARFFDKALASPDQADDDLRRTFERKEFGGNFGGPVRFPGLYDGSDRTFFFFDYEGRRQLLGATQTVQGLPTQAERSGDFSALEEPIIDPATGEPFPNNQIPANRISPIAQFYLGFLPTPDASGQAIVAANEITNFDQFTFRLDHVLTDSQTLTYALGHFDRAQQDPFAFGGASVPGFGALDLRTTQNHTLRHTYTITPTLVNSYQFGYARNNQPSVAPENTTSASEIGFNDTFVANRTFEGPPFIRLFERGLQLGNSIQGPQARVSENFQMQDAVSWLVGDHHFKFGVDGTFHKQDQAFLFINQGLFTFSGNFGANTTGEDLADFLIGTSPIAAQFGANGLRDYRQWATAFFVQDSWRVSPQLSLSLGLRWEYNSPLTDLFDRVAYYRPGSVSQLLLGGDLIDPETGAPIIVPPDGEAPNGLVYVGDPDNVLGDSVPRGGINKDWNNFAPRIGIAYSPPSTDGFWGALLGDQKTVIRAGFGVFYAAIIGDTALQQLTAPGFNGTNAFFFPGSGTLADPFAPDPFPDFNGDQGTLPNPFEASQITISAPLSQMARPIDPNLRTPYTYHYNFTIERGLFDDYVITASYVGNRSLKLYALEQVNPALGTFIPASPDRTIPTPTPTNTNARRLNEDFLLGLSQQVSAGNSWYNALQLQMQKRYSGGFNYQVSYTWSKNITDLAGTVSSGAGNTPRGTLDLLNRSAGRGLALEDVPHRFVASWIWDLPFARNLQGPAGVFLDGWSFGGIATFASGQPFNVTNPFDTTGSGGAVISFADLGNEPFSQLDPRENDARAFNAGAFQAFGDPASGFDLATDFRRGTLGPTQFRLHNGINNFDLILTKKTQLWSEDSNLELRVEFFNAFNHTQFQQVDLNLSNTNTFGKFTSAAESRVIQLGARISF